ncbi:MAG: (deoxy)nucleoside triphosphate pyrophosphohydrolase [Erysipelotrichaceae bacterium]|uniref:(deoxy)nucleoside triphosphate pyrophosphohydrolase n=1 Tax=Floccifex sp. TaxID=2815810 RepID=UPI002A7579E9|nr:(deoxy)nucleoside triphosphate pyrophosphohydrolase [Floccifex sp.]MDD7280710.1 (deoxy)nucleoside triphosphate pyrophosphohydrolase [Erysipelotrichaceae bacterium]MDY2959140.1 (deoxy)nucleoside triphosphate pyrophosphohydrolase [Floccifex sp.]
MKNIKVVAAIIVDNGKYLACERGYGEFKGLWEFPGGKVEKDESLEDALVREIQEELDVMVHVDSYFDSVEWDYPSFHLSMACFMCSIESGIISLNEHNHIQWLHQDELDDVHWLDADKIIVEKLKEFICLEG